MTSTIPVSDQRQATLNAAGTGLAQLGPRRAGISWHVTSLAVACPQVASTPAVSVHLGSESGPQLAWTWDASDSTDLDVILFAGQYITVKWSNGTPGTICTASIVGTLETG